MPGAAPVGAVVGVRFAEGITFPVEVVLPLRLIVFNRNARRAVLMGTEQTLPRALAEWLANASPLKEKVSIYDLPGCLAAELNGLLPACPTGQTCGEQHTLNAANPCIRLKHLPAGDITIMEPCGNTLAADDYVVDWTTGTILAPCTAAHVVRVRYTFNLAETYIRQAVHEIGYLIRQRNTVQTPLVACCGVVSLPCSVYRILSMTEVDCAVDGCGHCHGQGCNRCRRACRCTNPNTFVLGGCSLYLRGHELVMRPAPCEDGMLEICYEGGYPLDEDECFVGLTPELAELVLLKAQAIAYRNPRLFLSLTEAKRSSDTDVDVSDEVTVVVKEKTACGKRETTTTTVTGSNAQAVSSSLGSLSLAHWNELAASFEAAYKNALLLRTESVLLPRRGYRNRMRMMAG